jgi:hypothetical protein
VVELGEEAPSLTLLIKSVSKHLSTPYKTGVYISIPDLVAVARSVDIPVVIRDTREWMVEELLKIAVDYGKLVDVVDKLKELIEDKRSQLEELLKLYPLAKPLYTDLIENTRSTLEKLEELKRVYVKYYSQTYS